MRPLKQIDHFKKFLNRDKDLRAITRYSLYTPMFYRTNLYTHSHRTAAITCGINPIAVSIFGVRYDPLKAEILALVHDDAEIIFGDVQAGNKSKMTEKQLAEVQKAELSAVNEIASRFPQNIGGYGYKKLLKDAMEHKSLEAKVVNYADKYDALGEAMHEAYGGNTVFAINIINEYGKIPTPFEYYLNFFTNFDNNFPELKPLLKSGSPLFGDFVDYDYLHIAKQGKPHTKNSLNQSTGNAHYDNWRQIILNDTNSEIVGDLYTQKEF